MSHRAAVCRSSTAKTNCHTNRGTSWLVISSHWSSSRALVLASPSVPVLSAPSSEVCVGPCVTLCSQLQIQMFPRGIVQKCAMLPMQGQGNEKTRFGHFPHTNFLGRRKDKRWPQFCHSLCAQWGRRPEEGGLRQGTGGRTLCLQQKGGRFCWPLGCVWPRRLAPRPLCCALPAWLHVTLHLQPARHLPGSPHPCRPRTISGREQQDTSAMGKFRLRARLLAAGCVSQAH